MSNKLAKTVFDQSVLIEHRTNVNTYFMQSYAFHSSTETRRNMQIKFKTSISTVQAIGEPNMKIGKMEAN